MLVALLLGFLPLAAGLAVPVTNPSGVAPWRAISDGNITSEEVIFVLYTRNIKPTGVHLSIGDTESWKMADFNASRPTKLCTHGYMSDYHSNAIQMPKNEFLKLDDMNVIAVDWGACAKNVLYEQCVLCAPNVGRIIADLLKSLRAEFGLSYSQVHLVGHSLGGQVMSFVSSNLEDGQRVSRISAMDPAGPLFDHVGNDAKLDASDADFVDTLQTYTGLLGVTEPSGHVSCYPNGGNNQPGCANLDVTCHHDWSIYYFIESINNPNAFMANKCDSLDAALTQNCTGPLGPMGYSAITAEPGIYWFNATAVVGSDI